MNAPAQRTWWESLRHSGLLLAPAQIREVERAHPVAPAAEPVLDALRREIMLLDVDATRAPDFVTWCFQNLFAFDRLDHGHWQRAQHVPAKYSHALLSGETLKPRQLWTGANFGVLPVFFDKSPRIGLHRGRKALSDVLQWLRLARLPLALLTNARQWRIVYAGLDADASCESELDQWLEEGAEGLQLQALRQLLQPGLWDPAASGETPPLAAAIAASRKGQAELSAVLGERVREAVETLVRAHGDALRQAKLEAHGADIYRAAVRVVMRMVVVLFAESRDLLPKTQPAFYDNYSLQGLFEQLQRQAARGRGRLALRFAAWPRILALFRLIHEGSGHEALPIREYGGELFAPGDPKSDDPLVRALAVFESACFDPRLGAIPDDAVHRMLELLTRSRIRIRQGRSSISTLMPVDFADLSSEYIGILYEGLLDYELRTAPADDSIIFLAVGNEPSLPLKRLEAMDDAQIREVIKELGEASGDAGEEDEAAPDAAEAAEPPAASDPSDARAAGDGADDDDRDDDRDHDDDGDAADDAPVADAAAAARARALAWTQRACLAAGMVRKPKGAATPEKRMQFDRAVQAAALTMLRRVVLPGEWYLVRWGGTRKGAGTFYTRPQLAIPLVQRTLQPLAFDRADPSDPPNQADPLAWTPKKPEQILALKVADIACGSGSFPIAALRFLTDALYRSLWAHNRVQGDAARRPLSVILGLREEDSLEAERLPVPPDAPEFEPRTKALLRRYVVERCIYAVDLDPLAVELCRMALWIETMDRDLPFSFLDHKVKCGNSLVGCWFDHFRHYPALAWRREGGDKTHSNGVHFAKEARTKALKAFVNDRLKPDLQNAITGQGDLFAGEAPAQIAAVHDAALAELRAIHDLPVVENADRARRFRELEQRPEWVALKTAFDRWCACWFWPADRLDIAPLPTTFAHPAEATAELAADLAWEKRFFHWEIEFPDVFDRAATGFDAVVGNPPWEIAKPNSKEFFSNLDPLYRSYGKQDALRRQTELFDEESVEREWLDYSAGFKEMSNFVGCAAFPYGDPLCDAEGGERFNLGRGKENERLHTLWRARRAGVTAYADAAHPFRHQGSADLNLYKLFLEEAHALLKADGRLGYLVPSGLYSDHGSRGLRDLFLDQCRWEWLFGFENREGIFEIDSRFKFNPVIVQKGGRTEAIRTAFMRRNVDDWAEAERFATPYTRERVTRFSPKSKAILEIQSARDLEILEKIYANSVLLGDDGPDGWGIEYAREFDMTNDSKLFPPRPKWEEQGYKPDEYSRWLKGNWQPISNLWKKLGVALPTLGSPPSSPDSLLPSPGLPRLRCAQPPYDTLPIPRADIPAGIILSRDATEWIAEDEIEDTALPLYQGRMIWQWDCAAAIWVGPTNEDWIAGSPETKLVAGRYLIRYVPKREMRLAFRDVQNATNQRTFIGAILPGSPAGNTVPYLSSSRAIIPALAVSLNSFPADRALRLKMSQNHVNWFYACELPVARAARSIRPWLAKKVRDLATPGVWFAPYWAKLEDAPGWRVAWALTNAERIRVRCGLDAVASVDFGLSSADLAHLLTDCDLPGAFYSRDEFVARMDSKGFWRVDKERDPELRHTVLTLVAFHDLQAKIAECGGDRERGIEAFLTQNGGEGWMLPETLRLADYGLGHDDRAKAPQPVASRLGPRFYDWQLAQPPEESWRECHLHARNLLGDAGYKALLAEASGEPATPKPPPSGFKLHPPPKQPELF